MSKKENVQQSYDEDMEGVPVLERRLARSLVIGLVAVTLGTIIPETVLAYDLNAGVAAGATPLIQVISAHWGKGVLLSGIGCALFGQGDLRERGIRAGVASAVSGAIVLGIIAVFG